MGSSGSGSSGGGGGGRQAVAAEEDVRNLQRVRRPSVRLQHSYLYEERPKFIPRKKTLKQKEPIKKYDKTRKVKFIVGQSSKNFAVNCTNNEKENEDEKASENEMSDDDINETIGNLRTVKAKARRKRNRASSSNNGASEKSLEKINETQVQENVELSSDGESENEEEENSTNDDDDGDDGGDDDDDRGSGGGGGNGSSPARRRRVARVVKERDGNGGDGDGVRDWLDELGLGKYAKLFEAHEVDEETLPLLAMDDLIDMGISAVGARRKMYTSIQKLSKGMS